MKPKIEVCQAEGHKNRLTITPNRVTLKVGRNTSDSYAKKIYGFTEYVLEQFVDIKDEWRGEIKVELDGLVWLSTVLRSGNRVRKYQAV